MTLRGLAERRWWLGGAVALAALAAVGPGLPGTATAQSGMDWPQFRFNAARTGVTPESLLGTTNVSQLTTRWTAAFGAVSETSPAVATDSSGTGLVYAGTLAGSFSAFNAGTGAPVWTDSLGTRGPAGSPAVSRNRVYVASSAGVLYVLNATTGAHVCSVNLRSVIDVSPDVVSAPDGSGPLVLLGGLSHKEWAVFGAGNKHGECKIDWTFDSVDGFPGTWSSPAFGTDALGRPVVVFGSKDTDDSVYSVDVTTGALVWKYQTATVKEQDVGGGPVISAPGTNGLADGAVYIEGKDGVVYALDLTTGTKLWSFTVGAPGLSASSGALAGNALVIGSDNGVYALNATTGAMLWHVLKGTMVASPAVCGPVGQQVAFIGGAKGNLYALSLATGATLWKSPTALGYFASPAVSQGQVFAVDRSSVLTAYSLPGT
ncbi:MAG TPA: PQQ-binding-like beta-propeller repeat protein [Streptosporangiaceae bacterium]|nr:PQQ-binding-like beta-propeller repeat protein [Streptosporangiaceae bacterium]